MNDRIVLMIKKLCSDLDLQTIERYDAAFKRIYEIAEEKKQ